MKRPSGRRATQPVTAPELPVRSDSLCTAAAMRGAPSGEASSDSNVIALGKTTPRRRPGADGKPSRCGGFRMPRTKTVAPAQTRPCGGIGETLTPVNGQFCAPSPSRRWQRPPAPFLAAEPARRCPNMDPRTLSGRHPGRGFFSPTAASRTRADSATHSRSTRRSESTDEKPSRPCGRSRRSRHSAHRSRVIPCTVSRGRLAADQYRDTHSPFETASINPSTGGGWRCREAPGRHP
jgi:hypothetical protein